MLHPGNRKVLAYVREYEDDVILCVANVSRVAQPVELELGAWKGRVPVEMLGRNASRRSANCPYTLTLPAYGFFWFRLSSSATPPRWHTERLPVEDLAVVVLFDGWNSFFRNRVVPWRIALAERTRAQLERELLPGFLRRQRWYAATAEAGSRVTLAEHALLQGPASSWPGMAAGAGRHPWRGRPRALLRAAGRGLRRRRRGAHPHAWRRWPSARCASRPGWACSADAMADEAFCRELVRAISSAQVLKGDGGSVHFTPGRACAELVGDTLQGPADASPADTQQQLRHPAGRTAVPEDLSAAAGRASTTNWKSAATSPTWWATPTARRWPAVSSFTLRTARYGHWPCCRPSSSTRVMPLPIRRTTWPACSRRLLSRHQSRMPTTPVERFELLARRVAELHLALARRSGDPAFDPEPVQAADLLAWARTVRKECVDTLALVDGRSGASALASVPARPLAWPGAGSCCWPVPTPWPAARRAGSRRACMATCTWRRCWSAVTTSSSSISEVIPNAASSSVVPSTARCAMWRAC